MRVMIVDDERPCLEELEYLLGKHPGIVLEGMYTNPLEALAAVEQSMPDAVFLDIVMPRLNGIELAKRIHSLDKNVKLVFVTAHTGLLAEVKSTLPFECLLKPVSSVKLKTTLEQLRRRRQGQP